MKSPTTIGTARLSSVTTLPDLRNCELEITVCPAIETFQLGRRYRGRAALRDCSMSIPQGRVVALVGPNGSGKTTLLQLAVGLLAPSTGTIRVLGRTPGPDLTTLSNVAFLPQEKPLYAGFTVKEMLKLGQRLNPSWDDEAARRRLAGLNIALDRRIGKLSGGQHTQVALTLALAKRPKLLLLDEPLADLDPLARHEVMASVMTAVAEDPLTVVLSSHVMPDLKETCDWLVVLNDGRVQVSGDITDLLEDHQVLTGPLELADHLNSRIEVVEEIRTDRQVTMLVRHDQPRCMLDPRWETRPVGLEQLVLGYMRAPGQSALHRPVAATS